MTTETATALLDEKRPSDIAVEDDYPREFSRGVAEQVASGSDLGPCVVYAPKEAIVVGEIGGSFTEPGTVEIGYALGASDTIFRSRTLESSISADRDSAFRVQRHSRRSLQHAWTIRALRPKSGLPSDAPQRLGRNAAAAASAASPSLAAVIAI